MRSNITVLVILMTAVLWGCSPKKPAAADATALPTFTIVESQETQEQEQIKAAAAALFTNRAFGELDALAAKYRASKEAYADGSWKLGYVYAGLEPGWGEALSNWERQEAGVDEWIRRQPESITARVSKARLLVGHAWAARGGGYADTVKEAQWTRFFELLGQASQALRDARQLSERCPFYWSSCQRTALGMQTEKADYDLIFEQAIKEFPDCWFYYHSRAVYLLPRYYGEPGDWEKDLTRSANRLGGEAGDMLYTRVVCHVHNYGGGIDVFEGNRISWSRVEKGFEGLLKQFPQSLALKNDRAFLAALAGDKEKARAYFANIQDQCDLAIWHDREKITNFVKWLNGIK